VVRVRQQIAMTRKLYERLDTISKKPDADPAGARLDAHVQALGQELILVETVHKALTAQLESELVKARDLEEYEAQDQAHRNDIALTTQVLNATLKRLTEINLVRDFGGFEAKVIAPPGRGAKVSPVLYQFVLLGLVIGALLGGGGALLLDLTDKSFHSAEDIRRSLGLSVVGHIPYRHRRGAATVRTAGPDGEGAEVDAGLTTVLAPMSPEAESYRGIRTALYFNTRGEKHKVLQVTSPNAGDGKTTVITNLAVAIAQSGRSVVLVDADMRRPRVHRVFGLSNRIGLSEAIAGAADPVAAAQPTVVPNLSVLPCGRRPPNPAELLTTPAFDAVLDDLREAYDFVLVDTPPLLAVSDPCAVAPRMDGLILVVRVTKNGRPAAEQARGLLDGLPVQLIGAVVNGVGKDGAMSGYGYGHYEYAAAYVQDYGAAEAGDDAADGAAEAAADPRAHTPSLNGHSPNGHA
jgi:capsular exopolysaccharide synthesis family protein